jgi:CRISPR type I-E-associated protein CasB/Cse2
MTREQKTALATAFYGWWARLHDPENNGRNAKRADRAALRRLDLVAGAEGPEPDVVAALSIPAFRELYGNLRAILPAASRREEDDRLTRLFIVATALAHIRKDDKAHRSTATALGGPDANSRLLQDARFVRLMRTTTAADLFRQSCRLCALMKGTAPVRDLAVSLYDWLDVYDGPRVRRNWARDYYGLTFDQPETVSSSTLTEA